MGNLPFDIPKTKPKIYFIKEELLPLEVQFLKFINHTPVCIICMVHQILIFVHLKLSFLVILLIKMSNEQKSSFY